MADPRALGFEFDQSVRALGVVGTYFVLMGVENRERDGDFEQYKETVLSSLWEPYSADGFVGNDAILSGFRGLHTAVGRSNRRFPSAPEVLVSRFIRTKSLPHINLLVDIYNLVSLRSRLALGAHDVAKIDGAVSLKVLLGHETFVPLGSDATEPVFPGEYSYVDASDDVICRMEVLQVEKTKVDLACRHAFYIVQGNGATSAEMVRGVGEELIMLTQKYCGGEVRMLYSPE